MASVSRTIGFAALIVIVPATLRAQGLPQGLPRGGFQTDVWGRVELTHENARVIGHAVRGGGCLPAQSKVLEGEWQGRVLVGQLTVCLLGPSCPPHVALPLLAFAGPEDGTLTAYVRPQSGCSATGVGLGGLVVFYPESSDGASSPSVPPAPGPRLKRNPEAAKAALDRGDQLMKEKKWIAAVAEFERSIALNDQNWTAQLSLATAQLMRNHPEEAISALDRARDLSKGEPLIYYHLACAYSRLGQLPRAMDNLERAVGLGLAINPEPEDEGLKKLGSDITYNVKYVQLMQRAANNVTAPNAKASAGRRQYPVP
jgi:tetratricopeptide (TPR) repeat protein